MLFQSVWNALTGRPAGTGVRDADFFYFHPDTSWDAEDAVLPWDDPGGVPTPD